MNKLNITSQLTATAKVEVFEIKDRWARISRYYDGAVEDLSGNVARWVFAKYLSSNRPTEEKVSNANSPVAKAIKSSDDFSRYQNIFVSAIHGESIKLELDKVIRLYP